jgi:hypothetical protein
MKRSEALALIANQLDFLNNKFEGVRFDFTKEELAHADVILTTLEAAGMQPPNITLRELIPRSLCQVILDVDKHRYACWEPENENKQR